MSATAYIAEHPKATCRSFHLWASLGFIMTFMAALTIMCVQWTADMDVRRSQAMQQQQQSDTMSTQAKADQQVTNQLMRDRILSLEDKTSRGRDDLSHLQDQVAEMKVAMATQTATTNANIDSLKTLIWSVMLPLCALVLKELLDIARWMQAKPTRHLE